MYNWDFENNKAAFGCNSNPKRPFHQTAICRALTAISLNGRLPSRTRQGGGLLSPFPLSALIIRSPLLYHAARAVSTPSNYPDSLLASDLQLVFSTADSYWLADQSPEELAEA